MLVKSKLVASKLSIKEPTIGKANIDQPGEDAEIPLLFPNADSVFVDILVHSVGSSHRLVVHVNHSRLRPRYCEQFPSVMVSHHSNSMQ